MQVPAILPVPATPQQVALLQLLVAPKPATQEQAIPTSLLPVLAEPLC